MGKTDFMTTSTIRSKASRRGFTLLEVIISSSLGAFILAGVLSSFLMLGRSGANVANYSVMESQARRALEEFSQDVRMAKVVVWNSSTSITLTVPNNYTATSGVVTYAYNSTLKRFYRMPGDATATINTNDPLYRTLIGNITDFNYSRFDRLNIPATLDTTTKRIQLYMKASTTTRTAATASNIILSSSYILRNKYAN